MKNILRISIFLLIYISAFGQTKPNIVMITVDDVGYFDLSCMHRGLATYKTPNIDRLAKEGRIISDYYAHPSCTPGRAALITGQYPIRTGLTSVGQPGQKIGLQKEDPTLAELLKPMGYKTALVGKWHLGDRNEFLPTAHGFDEFYGMMYHLNQMTMLEQPEFPKNPNFIGRPRNMIHSFATEQTDSTNQNRWGMVGKQKIEDIGVLDSKRLRTIDEDFAKIANEWIDKNQKSPFFLWFNPTRMHQPTLVSEQWRSKSGMSEYADGLMQLDAVVGMVLDKLKALNLDENTIVVFNGDNGVNMSHWPDAGTGAFRGEKGTTWDGGFRVPSIVRWTGKIPANTYTGEFMTGEDWLPTLLSLAGDKSVTSDLRSGKRGYKVNIDGYDQSEMLLGDGASKRREFFYYSESELTAIRFNHWKVHLATKDEWMKSPEKLDGGLLVNIKLDPFERSPESQGHFLWMKEKTWVVPIFGQLMQVYQKSLTDFPPRQAGGGVGIQRAMKGAN